jgi:hypothetical protein
MNPLCISTQTEMVATQRRCSGLEETNFRLEGERGRQESELNVLRQQLSAMKEAGRAGFEWCRQLEAQVKVGAAALALFSPYGNDSFRS